MSFSTLPTDLQNYLSFQHSYITKWLVFLVITLLSIYYIFVIWEKQKQTKYITNAIIRIIFFALSFVYLILTPYLILLMDPSYSFGSFYSLPLLFYEIIGSIIFILLFIDMIRYGPLVLLRMAGLDIEDSNVNEIVRQIEHNKHFLKFKQKMK